jgi:hypothetical protein
VAKNYFLFSISGRSAAAERRKRYKEACPGGLCIIRCATAERGAGVADEKVVYGKNVNAGFTLEKGGEHGRAVDAVSGKEVRSGYQHRHSHSRQGR